MANHPPATSHRSDATERAAAGEPPEDVQLKMYQRILERARVPAPEAHASSLRAITTNRGLGSQVQRRVAEAAIMREPVRAPDKARRYLEHRVLGPGSSSLSWSACCC